MAKNSLVVDAHAHFVPGAMLDELTARKGLFPSVQVAVENGAVRMAFAGQDAKRPVPAGMSDVERRRAWLAERGIDKQVVGGWLDTFGYDLPADEGLEWNRFINAHMLEAVAKIPFFVPLASVPMQSGKHAARVLEEALKQGFHGAMIGTQPKGASGVLDDPDLEPFWEAASALQATLFVHPTFGARDDRLKAHGLVSAVGRVTDTTIAVARLLYSGHLTRYPGVNLVLSHGGAALPMVLGRLRRSFETAPAGRADPTEGFGRLFFDSVVYDTITLRFVREIAGADRILMGTDEPFAIGEPQPVRFVKACKFDARETEAILGGNAVRLFKI
jgi:aminocarboxymuconate-semialdehyde decarboxylase